MYKLGWFSTGRDKAARDLLTAVNSSIQRGEIEAEFVFVFCNREPGESEESDLFLELVEDEHIPLVCYSYQKYKKARGEQNPSPSEPIPQWRLDYDREVMKRLENFYPDLCVLAGYMLIVGKEMCRRYDMINLHPAAPGGPTGSWQDVIWQLIDSNAQETGVMMHLVTPEMDKGAPVAYCTFPIAGEPFDRYWQAIARLPADSPESGEARNSLFKLIRQYGLTREFPLIIASIKAFSQGKIKISNEKKVVDAEDKPVIGYNLTEEINEKVKEVLLK